MAFAEDYVSVHTRVAEFYGRFPEGSIQTEIVTHTDTLVVVKAYAYRTADDARPATGHSQLGIPGKTSYTRDSEVENCETSAVGRALANLGFAPKDGPFASREEVQNKHGGGEESGFRERMNGAPKKASAVDGVLNVIKAMPAKGTAGDVVKEATAMALGVQPSEINRDILPDYIEAWLEQPGNSVTAFQRKFKAALDDLARESADI